MIDALRDLDLPAGTWPGEEPRPIAASWRATSPSGSGRPPIRKAHFGRVLLDHQPLFGLRDGYPDREPTGIGSRGMSPPGAQKVGDAPGLLGALGKKYAELKQYDEAEKCLKRYVELSGDEWAYQELAACYEARGDRNRAKAALDDYLNKTESAGLEHAQVQVQIANKLMKEGRWEEAKPYAEAAAATWAAFGMECASPVRRGTQGMGRGRALDEATQRALPGTRLGTLVYLLQTDRPRRPCIGPSTMPRRI